MRLTSFLKKSSGFVNRGVRYIKQHPFISLGLFILSGFVSLALLFLFVAVGLFGHVPGKQELARLENPVTSTIYGSDGMPIGSYFLQNRSNIDSSELKPLLVKALVATEDVRFFEHSGIDYKSYARVVVKSLIMRQGKGGGSTITQQIAKNLYGRQSLPLIGTLINKIREIIIANRLEKVFDKNELLLLYFNTVSFGENIYGIEKAAERFFSKKPSELNLAECATLVGVLKATSYYNPRKHPEKAEGRRNIVLDQMVKNNDISAEEAANAKTAIALKYSTPVKNSSLSGYYKEFIKQEFDRWAEDNPGPNGEVYDLETSGLLVFTTLQPNIQKYAESAMTRTLNRLQNLMAENWESNTTEGGKEALKVKLLSQVAEVINLKEDGKSAAAINAYLQAVKPRKYWEIGQGFELRELSLQDSIINEIIRLHTGIFAVNSRSGGILGYVGGIDYGYSQLDNIQNRKQVGSTFKPITYLTALERGVDACDFYDNALRTYEAYESWKPRNSDNRYGGSYSVHGALANSINTVSVSLQLKMGTTAVMSQAAKMGIASALPDVPSIVLGTADLSLFEMVKAYASISNGGFAIEPYIIQKIVDDTGEVIFEREPTFNGRVASAESIAALQQMMEEVLTEGSGKGFGRYEIPFNLIGKTGTTQNNGEGWFIGCSPEIVIGAWVGTQDKRVHFKSTSLGSGANTAMPMVASMFKRLSSWKNPMLTNFEFETPYFPCPMYSDTTAAIATEIYKSDSFYVQQLLAQDTVTRFEDEALDSTKIDSFQLRMTEQLESKSEE